MLIAVKKLQIKSVKVNGRIDLFIKICEQVGLPIPAKEVTFYPGRRWRVDYLFKTEHITIALEVEGWGHKTTERYEKDLDKYNALTEVGIFLLRTKPKNLNTTKLLDTIKRAIENAKKRTTT